MALNSWDFEQLRQLFARLAFNIDHGNAQAYADDYTEDGSFEVLGLPEGAEHAGKHQGRAGVEHFINLLYSGIMGHCRHWNQNFVFTEQTDTQVKVTSYLTVFRVGVVPQAGVILTGVYHDTLVKVDDRWYMKERFVRADPQLEHTEPSTDVLVLQRDAVVAAR